MLPVAQTRDATTQFVICSAALTKGSNVGKTLDMGTMLISSGFGLQPSNLMDSPSIWVTPFHRTWPKKNQGPSAFSDFPDPNSAILQALPQQTP